MSFIKRNLYVLRYNLRRFIVKNEYIGLYIYITSIGIPLFLFFPSILESYEGLSFLAGVKETIKHLFMLAFFTIMFQVFFIPFIYFSYLFGMFILNMVFDHEGIKNEFKKYSDNGKIGGMFGYALLMIYIFYETGWFAEDSAFMLWLNKN